MVELEATGTQHTLQNPSSCSAEAGVINATDPGLVFREHSVFKISYLITSMPSAVREDTWSALGGIKGRPNFHELVELHLWNEAGKKICSLGFRVGVRSKTKHDIRKQNLASAIRQTTSCAHFQKTNKTSVHWRCQSGFRRESLQRMTLSNFDCELLSSKQVLFIYLFLKKVHISGQIWKIVYFTKNLYKNIIKTLKVCLMRIFLIAINIQQFKWK